MKRREYTDEEWNLILKLKQGGASWLKVEKETGIPRRTIKRAYEEWESARSTDELKQARIDVAAEVFRDHIDDQITLAELLIKALHTPAPMQEIPKASDVFNDLWKTDIPNIYDGAIPEGEEPRIKRRNLRLLRSLKEHTLGKVRWEVLEEWERALEQYRIDSRKLRIEAHKSAQGLLTERPELVNKIKAKYTKKEIVEKMGMGITEALWRNILAGEVDRCDEYIKTQALGGGRWQVYFGKEASRTVIDLDNAELAEELAEVCCTAARTIIQGEKSVMVEELAADIKTMEKKKQSLEDMLDRIVLRPIILRTRCELCPA